MPLVWHLLAATRTNRNRNPSNRHLVPTLQHVAGEFHKSRAKRLLYLGQSSHIIGQLVNQPLQGRNELVVNLFLKKPLTCDAVCVVFMGKTFCW